MPRIQHQALSDSGDLTKFELGEGQTPPALGGSYQRTKHQFKNRLLAANGGAAVRMRPATHPSDPQGSSTTEQPGSNQHVAPGRSCSTQGINTQTPWPDIHLPHPWDFLSQGVPSNPLAQPVTASFRSLDFRREETMSWLEVVCDPGRWGLGEGVSDVVRYHPD